MINFLFNFWTSALTQRGLILQMAIRDFKNNTAGSALGLLWVILEPIFYLSVLWFVFTNGLKLNSEDHLSFPKVMIAMTAWIFFANVANTSAQFFKNYRFLLNREFNFSILPLVKVLSGLFSHLIFLAILIIVLLVNGISFSLYWFQSIYFLFCLACLLLGFVFAASSIGVFVKDTSNTIGVALQFGFWMSPVVWETSKLPVEFQWIGKFNPLSYPINGYRDSFLHQTGLLTDLHSLVYFWSFVTVLLLFGISIFRYLRPNFGDAL